MLYTGLIFTIIASVALVLIAIFTSLPLFIRNRKDAIGLIYFVILCVSLAVWLMANILSDIIIPHSLFWVRCSFASISVGLYSFLMFANYFPHSRHIGAAENIAHSAIAGLIVLMTFSDMFIPSVTQENGVSTVVPGSLYGLFIGYVVYALLVSISRVLRVKTLAPAYWDQARLILIGIGTASGVALLTNLILPLIFDLSNLYWLASVAILVFVDTTAYAIVKHRLFDLRGALARMVAYVSSVAVLGFALGILVVAVIDWFDLAGYNLQIAIIATTVVVAALYPLIKLFFDTVTEKIFYRKTYNVQYAINEMTTIFSRAKTLDVMASRTINQLKRFLGSDQVALAITPQLHAKDYRLFSSQKDWPDMKQLEGALNATSSRKLFAVDSYNGFDESVLLAFSNFGIGIISQLQLPTGRMGYLLFGHRRNGTAYTKRDLIFINTISDECAIAIQNLGRLNEIMMLNSGLEDKINVATEQLRASNKKLKALDKSKDEFISLTSHQLRTPLTTIKGYLSMLLDGDAGELTPQQRKLLEETFNSSQRMVHLISDFLNISRIQTGRFELELTDVNLSDVLDEEIQLLRISASPRRITLDYQKPDDFPVLQLDESKLRQVMMNFIDNAIHYSTSGSKIQISLVARQSEIEFRVKDYGIGVPKAEQHKLFVKFARATNARKQRPDGTGIGLFMAKKAVVALGGSIIFESVEGKGSTFGFVIPRK